MEALLQAIGLTTGELTNLVILAIAALVALFILRTMFRLTATLLRMGCAVIVIGVIVMFLLSVFN